MREYQATILENKPVAENIYSLTLALPEAVKIRAGQFADLSVGGAHLLKRPLAVCKADGEKVTVCYQIRGEGTKLLSERKAGETLDALLPLGNGFYLKENEKKIALVGGGVGIFPMISVIGEYAAEKEISAYIGFRNKGAVCGLEELKRAKKLTAVTDDGSFGEKMNAVQAFAADLEVGERPDVVLSCGPLPMLRALKTALEGRDIPCYVSLEERMGCGIGACLVCVCEKTNGENARVCKDGPVFGIGEVVL